MFRIYTDSTADLPKEYLEENDLGCMNLSYLLDGVVYGNEQTIEPKQFYQAMRDGKLPTTSQINPEEAKCVLEKEIKNNPQILFLAFSSGLSGSYNSIRIAAETVMEEHPECKIIVLDTLAASMGEGLIVYKAVELRKAGKSMEETAKWIKEHLQEFVHVFTVDDLFHLFRGGRVSKTAAVLGTLVGIKPLLIVNEEGKLINIDKIRGRKKSLNACLDLMEEKTKGYDGENDIVMISHGDALEDAEYLKEQVKARFGVKQVIINDLGPVIGSHTGPGLVAMFFMGKSR